MFDQLESSLLIFQNHITRFIAEIIISVSRSPSECKDMIKMLKYRGDTHKIINRHRCSTYLVFSLNNINRDRLWDMAFKPKDNSAFDW